MRKNRAVIFQDLLLQNISLTHPAERTNEQARTATSTTYVLLWQKEESWGKQPNSLNTRSKKAINLEAK